MIDNAERGTNHGKAPRGPLLRPSKASLSPITAAQPRTIFVAIIQASADPCTIVPTIEQITPQHDNREEVT